MAEYIEREAAIKVLRDKATANSPSSFYRGLFTASYELDDIPAADVAPVRHGEWLPTTKWWQGGSAWKQCSECGILHLGKSNFCPNCGAKMDGVDDG